MIEYEELIDELVAKAGPTMGCIKVNQDPVKVARLRELGYNEPAKEKRYADEGDIEDRLEALEATVLDHEKRITECSVRR